jgi:hypothetical protein
MSSKDGDYYLNSTTGDVYQKVSGTWVKKGNIKGPKGDAGPQGPPYTPSISKVRAYNDFINQSITNNQWYRIVFPKKEFDVLNEFDNVTNSRFIASQAGYYLITATVGSTSTSTTAWLNLSIWKNGIVHSTTFLKNQPNPVVSITDVVYLNVNDYIELYAISGNSVNLVLQLGQTNLWMSIFKIV